MSPKASRSANPEFQAVFTELRMILARYEARLKVIHDQADYYYLDTHTIGKNKRPIMFGAVQGKACFKFTEVDQALMKELARLTKAGYDSWKKIKWVD